MRASHERFVWSARTDCGERETGYSQEVDASQADWIASTGPTAVEADPAIPDAVLGDPNLSLTSKGIYALLLNQNSCACLSAP